MNLFRPENDESSRDLRKSRLADRGVGGNARGAGMLRHDRPAYHFLLIFAGAIIIPVIIFASVIAWYYVDAERARALDRASQSAREALVAVDRELMGSQAVLKTLATTPSLLQDDLKGFYDQARQVAQVLGVEIVVRKPGQLSQLLNTSVPWGTLPAQDNADILAFEQKASHAKQPVITGLMRAVDGSPGVVAIVPVFKENKVVYFLSAETPAAYLASVLKRTDVEPGWFSVLIVGKGHTIARSVDHEKLVGKAAAADWTSRAPGVEGTWEGRTLDGIEVIFAYVRSSSTGWTAAVTVPTQILNAPLLRALWTLLVIGTALLIVALVLAYWAGSYLSRAISSLQNAGVRLKNSQSVPPIATSVREINAVGHALRTAASDAERREAHLHSILATVPSAMIVIDSKGTIDFFSKTAEEMFGYSAEEVRGHNVNMLMPEPDRSAHDGYLNHYLTTGEKRIIGMSRIVTGLRRNGIRFPLQLHVGEADVEGERLFTGFMEDQTEKQRIEQELLQTQKMEAIGKLTGGVAHDFNNLLTVIKGNLEMLEPLLDDDNLELLRDSQEAADLAAQLTTSLLAFGRRMPLNPRLLDIGQLINSTGDLLRRTLGETIEIRTVITNACRAVIDGPQLQNAILNLAINARDAMSGGGMLSIEVSEVELDDDYATAYNEVFPGRYVMILISDTGIGMSQEVRKRAFEPFFTTKPQGSGTGLGLSSVYGFVKQSGGHITLYSEPSRGTTIRIYLPCSSDSSGSFVHAPTDAATYPKGHGELVLVVEDDDRVRRVTVARLKTLAYKVIESVNGPTALAILEENPNVDLLFTDMVMPGGMTGAELAAQAQVKWPRMKILFTSGYAEPEVVRQADSKSGDWLRKPYAASELAHKLRTIFGEKHGK